MSEFPRFRVAISGGGIGGLALAAFICYHSKDIAVDIYETKDEISSIGAGIAIWKRTWQTLQDIGLEEEVKQRNLSLPKDGEVRGPVFRKADQVTTGIDFHNHMMPSVCFVNDETGISDGPLTVPRPVLLDMLKSRLSGLCSIHTATHVLTYEETSDGVMIKFKDGSTQTADLLIGCDGVHSATRATLFQNLARTHPSEGYEKFMEPKWSGTLAYRCVTDRNKLREKNPDNISLDQARIVVVWKDKGMENLKTSLHLIDMFLHQHVVTHPFGDIVNLVCFYNKENGFGAPYTEPWVSDVSVEEVISCYPGWEPDVVEVLSDAHILGRLLADKKTTLSNLSAVLQIYQEVRLPLANKAAERSWSNGLLYDFTHPNFQIMPTASADDLKPIGKAVGETFAWLGKGGCDEDWNKAKKSLDMMEFKTAE
ncbi:hypothetical protein H0H92_003599 [Tricholoma furcatifolium]|nr:hypothetical protein H0H92_003599 [Tricholoma furcatifolium]